MESALLMLPSAVEFTKSPHCRHEAHCGTCRNLEGGRAWREQIAKRFSVPEVDWSCPRGHEWGYKPPARESKATKPDSESVVARRAACEACDVRDCFLKRLLRDNPCTKAFRARIVLPGMVCPKGRWSSPI